MPRSPKGDALIGTAKGDRIQQVPEVTFNAAAEYNFPLVSDWEGYVRGDYSYYDDSLSANNVSATMPPRVRDSFELLNFRIGAFQQAVGMWLCLSRMRLMNTPTCPITDPSQRKNRDDRV